MIVKQLIAQFLIFLHKSEIQHDSKTADIILFKSNLLIILSTMIAPNKIDNE